MVGGTVIEIIDTGPTLWINCRGLGSEKYDECAIYVERSDAARSVSEGDSIWWHGRWAYWAPQSREFTDYPLARVGFSGVPRPSTRGKSMIYNDVHSTCPVR